MFLSSIEEVLAGGLTPADQLLRDFDKEWNGDIEHMFEAYAY